MLALWITNLTLQTAHPLLYRPVCSLDETEQQAAGWKMRDFGLADGTRSFPKILLMAF